MSLKFRIPSEVLFSLVNGAFLSFWIIGSAIIIFFLMRYGLNFLAGKRRFNSVGGSKKKRLDISLKDIKFVRELSDEMDIAELKMNVETLLGISLLMGIVTFFGSNSVVYILQQNFASGEDLNVSMNFWYLSLIVAALIASLPYFYVRLRVQHKRHKIALRMIMLIQNLIGHYQSRLTVAEIIKKSMATTPEEISSEWRRLELSLHMNSVKDALYEFARRVGNSWADDLVETLLIGTEFGTDISGSLKKLVVDMQIAKKNEENRIAMISVYRIGTVLMVFFAFLVVLLNIYSDGSNFHHYFVETGGKRLMMISVIVLFLSLISVVRSGRKQF
jgi:Flp pilus assembly protein TadB